MKATTLKEKFIKLTKKYSPNWGWYEDLESAEQCVKIADEFAIGFAEWLNGLDINDEVLQKHISTKELLEIYKQTL